MKELEEVAKAGHGKAALFLAELYYQGFESNDSPESTVLAKDGNPTRS